MIVRVSTVRFQGAGQIDCRLCGHRTVFPNNAAAIVYKTGDRQIVLSATDRSVLHCCGLDYYWTCPECPLEPDTERVIAASEKIAGSSGHRRIMYESWMHCSGCGAKLVQRSRTLVP